MKLSVIIVSYNVRDLLRQAIDSIIIASKGFHYEIIVIDNNSKDDTGKMIKLNYPKINLIENENNLGFSKANNQAIEIAKGEYLLIINPDTITSKDTIHKIIHFMDNHPDAGGLGVRMIDGQGKYLKESKRGFPTPWASFTKFTGLYKLFSTSKFWNQYYAGHVGEDENSKVDILAGAFMFLRSTAIKSTGGFDERFFMYGEDIDLSYRLKLAGYNNYYFPETYIIHFKGQSTKKMSIRYIRSFYGAMFIFFNKYFLRLYK